MACGLSIAVTSCLKRLFLKNFSQPVVFLNRFMLFCKIDWFIITGCIVRNILFSLYCSVFLFMSSQAFAHPSILPHPELNNDILHGLFHAILLLGIGFAVFMISQRLIKKQTVAVKIKREK